MLKYFRLRFRFRGDIHMCKKLHDVIDTTELFIYMIQSTYWRDLWYRYIF